MRVAKSDGRGLMKIEPWLAITIAAGCRLLDADSKEGDIRG
jgi:hypothetical protein